MKIWIPIVLVVVVIGGLIGFSLSRRDRSLRVDVATVERRDLSAQVRASGTIEPKKKVDVSANAMGTVTRLAVAEGQNVDEGALLLEIDPTEYRAAVEALVASVQSGEADLRLAEASLEKAEQDYQRAAELFDQGLTSDEALLAARTTAKVEQARVEAARHRLTQVRANLEKARHDLQKVTITAPMTGLITRLNVEEGENAIMGTLNNPGTVLLTIADMGTMEAVVEVDETEVVQVALGQKAVVEIDAFPGEEFPGSVTEIGNSPITSGAGQQAVDFEVKVTMDQAPATIRPGLSAKARIHVAERDSVLAVPLGAVTARDWPLRQSAIEQLKGNEAKKRDRALADLGFTSEVPDDEAEREETEGVFVVEDGYAKFVPVTLGIAGEEHFEITTGLAEGQTVVGGPFRILRELKDGAKVRPAQTDEKEKAEDDAQDRGADAEATDR
ncbi:MAG TPA: efflux RND transporter periplasmic adaptor subunit [Candidatus Krumholzibacteria bacterium]|nr:efflux RND transporter periplasmic adaptor subunit [Candidatus Krumholzibacteria bacterium]HPD70907.1 efflux RND transporter periplasmic adaptor subunit [Candidatus Krumholzibacteria bacterium]HRY39393.1 efflux RND transporter periplasmic adaptor subunit [Candidatus Krumholzibacteria bacterium]